MKKIFNYIMLLAVAVVGLTLTACSEDDIDTNQYGKNVSLNVYGPQPVMRGGTLRFLGSNLDQIAQVIIPGVDPITNIEVVKAGVPSEIRVQVPKDGPEPGQVTLITKTDLKIVTKSALSYEEPIEIESITAKAMPGDVIEIKGDYLNLIHMVEFTDGVRVSEADFNEHSRYLIKVKVPEEAKTGKLKLYTYDLVADAEAEDQISYNIVETELAVAIGTPTVARFKSPRGEADALGEISVKLGETITIEGAHLSLAKAVYFGDDENRVLLKDVEAKDNALTCVLPAEAPDGDINIVVASGVEIPVGRIVTVAPSECVASPDPVKNGNELTIAGKDLDVVVAVEWPNVAEATAVENPATDKITVVVPELAQEGSIVLRMLNGKGVEVPFTLVKPTMRGYSPNPVSAGSALSIRGNNLDLIKSISFGCDPVEVEVSADGKTLTVTVPMEAVSGKPVFNLKNGSTVEGKDLTVQEAVFCYATELPDPDEEIKAGDVVTLLVKNADKLTGVEVNGETAQYILSGEKLLIGTPASAGRGTKIRLISSNGEITYTIDIKPNSEIVTVLWTGMGELGWSGDGQIYMGTDGGPELLAAGAKAGDLLRIKFTPTADDWCFQLWEGHWGAQYGQWGAQGDDNTPYDLEGNKGYFYFELTDDLIKTFTTPGGWGGIVLVQGQSLIVTELALVQKVSMEETIWKGDFALGSWAAGMGDLSWGGYDWSQVKPGKILRLHYVVDESVGYINIRFGNGSWAALPSTIGWGQDGNAVPDPSATTIETKLTQEDLDQLVNNGGLVVCGAGIICKSIGLE